VNQEDEQMKALLANVGEQPGPPLGFTADGIARRSRRIRLVRWGAGVAAGVVAAAAITTTVIITTSREVVPATPPSVTPTVTPTGVPTTTDVPTTTTTTPTGPSTTT
jgi:hypothetical protein